MRNMPFAGPETQNLRALQLNTDRLNDALLQWEKLMPPAWFGIGKELS